MYMNHWRAAALSEDLGLSDAVRASVAQTFERWDGRGPDGIKGEDVLPSARLVHLADVVEVFITPVGWRLQLKSPVPAAAASSIPLWWSYSRTRPDRSSPSSIR